MRTIERLMSQLERAGYWMTIPAAAFMVLIGVASLDFGGVIFLVWGGVTLAIALFRLKLIGVPGRTRADHWWSILLTAFCKSS